MPPKTQNEKREQWRIYILLLIMFVPIGVIAYTNNHHRFSNLEAAALIIIPLGQIVLAIWLPDRLLWVLFPDKK